MLKVHIMPENNRLYNLGNEKISTSPNFVSPLYIDSCQLKVEQIDSMTLMTFEINLKNS